VPRPAPRGPAAARPAAPRTPILRVLPVLIFFGGVMIVLRVADLVLGLGGVDPLSVAELQAQQPPAKAAAAAAPAPAGGSSAPFTPVSAPAAEPPAASMTPTELDVLNKLQERRLQIDARERDVERREALLKAAEDQIDRKVAEMKTLQSTIEGLLRQYNDQEDNKMRSLVKIYENMKPKEAAKIFEQLDMSILLEVVERMKEQRVAPIMAEMDPMKAKAVTAELAQRRQMPTPRGGAGG